MQILVSILDPNRAVDNNYFRVVVRMNDGSLHEGVEVQVDKQAMADLIGYLKNWRYTGGESPRIQVP